MELPVDNATNYEACTVIYFSIARGEDYFLSAANNEAVWTLMTFGPYLSLKTITSHLFEIRYITFQTKVLLAKMSKMAKFI